LTNRRDWIANLLLIGGGVVIGRFQGRAAESPDGAWTPVFLTAAQNETLVALGARILPGSSEALCNRIIDLVLAIESDKTRTQFTEALAAFDATAHRLHAQPFSRMSATQQDTMLEAASHGGDELEPAFSVIKEWMADTYWSSQQGLKDLGWNGQMAWASYPSCAESLR
jgi:hypothetical protein